MGKLNAYAGLFGLIAVGLLAYFMFFNGNQNKSTAGASSKGEASFLGRKRRK